MGLRTSQQACFCGLLLVTLLLWGPFVEAQQTDLKNKHFFAGSPKGTPETNDLIFREIYALSSNDDTKMADWVAYRLDKDTVFGSYRPDRGYEPDPDIAPAETLEREDYKGAFNAHKYTRGHQAPRGSFKGSKHWKAANYISNLTPQKEALNGEAWERLERRIRAFVKKGNVTYVITGPLYERDMPPLPKADEPHKVPPGYWKIVVVGDKDNPDTIRTAAFIFNQDTPKDAKVLKHLTSIDEIQSRSGLDFFSELPDEIANRIERKSYEEWAKRALSIARDVLDRRCCGSVEVLTIQETLLTGGRSGWLTTAMSPMTASALVCLWLLRRLANIRIRHINVSMADLV